MTQCEFCGAEIISLDWKELGYCSAECYIKELKRRREGEQ